jgi:5-methyltetrahydropteroyltriglutamate--homocysteine methyltransferase
VPLRFVPKSKRVVLGLISSKTPVLESLEMLPRARTRRRTILTSIAWPSARNTVAGKPATEGDERAKLTLAVEAAKEIWG